MDIKLFSCFLYMSKYYGGLFWDVLLLSEYNESWEDFYLNMVMVIPCEECVKNNIEWLKSNRIPKFKNTDEKNKWLWENRYDRGGCYWRDKVKNQGYTLETWLGQYKDKLF